MTLRRGPENKTLETTFSCDNCVTSSANDRLLRSHSGRSHIMLIEEHCVTPARAAAKETMEMTNFSFDIF